MICGRPLRLTIGVGDVRLDVTDCLRLDPVGQVIVDTAKVHTAIQSLRLMRGRDVDAEPSFRAEFVNRDPQAGPVDQ